MRRRSGWLQRAVLARDTGFYLEEPQIILNDPTVPRSARGSAVVVQELINPDGAAQNGARKVRRLPKLDRVVVPHGKRIQAYNRILRPNAAS